MVLNDLIGKEVIWKGNKCLVLNISTDNVGAIILQLETEETDTTSSEVWVGADEVRIDVYFTKRPRLFGSMVDIYGDIAKVEWQDADGTLVPFRKYPPSHEKSGQLMLDSENRPMMTMKVFDCKLDDISLY